MSFLRPLPEPMRKLKKSMMSEILIPLCYFSLGLGTGCLVMYFTSHLDYLELHRDYSKAQGLIQNLLFINQKLMDRDAEKSTTRD